MTASCKASSTHQSATFTYFFHLTHQIVNQHPPPKLPGLQAPHHTNTNLCQPQRDDTKVDKQTPSRFFSFSLSLLPSPASLLLEVQSLFSLFGLADFLFFFMKVLTCFLRSSWAPLPHLRSLDLSPNCSMSRLFAFFLPSAGFCDFFSILRLSWSLPYVAS